MSEVINTSEYLTLQRADIASDGAIAAHLSQDVAKKLAAAEEFFGVKPSGEIVDWLNSYEIGQRVIEIEKAAADHVAEIEATGKLPETEGEVVNSQRILMRASVIRHLLGCGFYNQSMHQLGQISDALWIQKEEGWGYAES